MRYRWVPIKWLMVIPLVVGWSMQSRAQDDPTPVDTGTCVLGTDQGGDGRAHPCSDFNRGSSSRNTYSGPSAADIEAEHAREAERERLAGAQQRVADEQRREAEKKKQDDAEWKQGVAEAVGSLKGVSPDNMEIKGASSGTFGLKGVSPDEAASNSVFGIKARAPDNYSRDVSSAWKQLHCANELAGYALSDLHKIETGDADARELDEIKYLAGEANKALNGNPVGVQCSAAPAMPTVKGFDPQQVAPIEKKLLTRTVQDAENIVTSREKVEGLQQKLDELKAQKASFETQGSKSAAKQTNPASPSQSGQSPSLSVDQQHINQVYQQQKENEKKKSDYLALLRETQRALNEANSQRVASAADAEKVEKEKQAIMAGQLPDASASVPGQVQKKKPPEEEQ